MVHSEKRDPSRRPYVFLLLTCTILCFQYISEAIYSRNDYNFSENIVKIRGFYFLQILSASFIACTIPMIVDALLEFFFDTQSFDFYERLFVLGVSAFPNIMLQISIQPLNYRTYKYVLVLISHDIICSAVVLWLISKFYPSKKKTIILLTVLLLRGLSFDMQSYSLFNDNISITYYVIQELFAWSSSMLYLYHVCDVLWVVSGDSSSPWQLLRRGELSEESILCLFYYFFYLVILNFNQVIRYGLFFDWKRCNGYTLSTMIVVNIAAISCLTILPGRIAKLQARFRKEMIDLAKRFVRYFSHELRSPLNVIGSGLSVLVEDSSAINLTANSVETLTDVMLSTDKTINLLDNLLQYEVVMNSMKKPEMNWVSLSKVIGTKFTAFETLADKSGILLEIGDPYIVLDTSFLHTRDSTWCNPLSVCGTKKTTSAVVSQIRNSNDMYTDDRHDSIDTSQVNSMFCNKDDIFMQVNDHQIERLVHNVMSAAIENTPRGGVVKVDMRVIEYVHVNESYEKPCGKLRIRISDHGLGLMFSKQMKVFDDISSIVRGELQGGGGIALSLWICCKIALFHEGTLSFQNAKGTKDSYIQLELPVFTKGVPDEDSPRSLSPRRGLYFTMSTKDPQQFAPRPHVITSTVKRESTKRESTRHIPRQNRIGKISDLRLSLSRNTSQQDSDEFKTPLNTTSRESDIGLTELAEDSLNNNRPMKICPTRSISNDDSYISHLSVHESIQSSIRCINKYAQDDCNQFDHQLSTIQYDNHYTYIKTNSSDSQDNPNRDDNRINLFMTSITKTQDNMKLPSKSLTIMDKKHILSPDNSGTHDDTFSVVPTCIGTQTVTTASSYQKKDHLTFLIVDDSHLNRKVLMKLSTRQSEMAHKVAFLHADDGTSAIELMRHTSESIDCVLLDNTMIKMHGPEAASIMRNELQYKGPILGVTGNALPDDVKEFLKSGADSIFIKPITTQKIQEMMRFFMK